MTSQKVAVKSSMEFGTQTEFDVENSLRVRNDKN